MSNPFDFGLSQLDADQMCQRWGQPGLLRRSALADRPCWMVLQEYTPIERIGKNLNPVDQRCLLSPYARGSTMLLVGPDPEQNDILVPLDITTLAEQPPLLIYAPAGRIAPAGIIVLWDLRVRNL